MVDTYDNYADGWHVPFKNGFAITPDNDTEMANVTRGIYVGNGGDVAVLLQGDADSVIFTAVPTGTTLNVRAIKVLDTGTSAGDLLGLY